MVSAYKDGAELVRKLRKRRRDRKAGKIMRVDDIETEELEDSLTRGESSIQRRYDSEYEKLGKLFGRGDSTAEIQLQSITIFLQGQVITNLKSAWDEDSSINYRRLQLVSDQTRSQAVECLISLSQRLGNPGPMLELKPLSPPLQLISGHIVPQNLRPIESCTQRVRTLSTDGSYTTEKDFRLGVQFWRRDTGKETSKGKNWASKFRDALHPRDPQTVPDTGNSTGRNHVRLDSTPQDQGDGRKDSEHNDERRNSEVASFITAPSISTPEQEENEMVQRVDSIRLAPMEADCEPISSTIPTTTSHSPRESMSSTWSGAVSPLPFAPRRSSAGNSLTSTGAIERRALLPGKHNHYRGLCKAAFQLQNNSFDKAIKKYERPSMESGGAKQLYWCCTTCNFECRPIKDSEGRDALDAAVYILKSSGKTVKFTWSFLFRSHVPIRNTKERKFVCLFCAERETTFEKQIPLPLRIFPEIDPLMAHILVEHVGAGRWPEGEVLFRMNCTVQGVSGVRDAWDIYLGMAA